MSVSGNGSASKSSSAQDSGPIEGVEREEGDDVEKRRSRGEETKEGDGKGKGNEEER